MSRWTNFKKYRNSSGIRKVIIILLLISIPNLVIGLIVYVFGARTLRLEMIENHETQILNQIDYIDNQFHGLEMNLNFTAHEPLFNEDFATINFQEDYELANDITNSLFSKQYSNPLIERVHFFIDGARPIAFNPQFRWVRDEDIADYRRYIASEDDFLWERNLFREPSDDHIFPLVLVKHMNPYIHSTRNNMGFIVELNQEAVTQQLNSLTISDDGLSFFIDERTGMIISNVGTSQYMEDFILSESMEEDTKLITWNNREYSMISGSINRVNHNWRYVSLVPISDIIQPVTTLSTIIITSSVAGIVLSLLISSLTLNNLFRPIRDMYKSVTKNEGTDYNIQELELHWSDMNQEKNRLEEQVEELNENIISNIFFKLIKNYYDYSEYEDLERKLIKFGMNPSKPFYTYLDTRIEEKVNRELFTNLVLFHIDDVFPVIFNERYTGFIIHHHDNEVDEKLNIILKEFDNKLVRYKNEAIEIYKSTCSSNLRELKEVVSEIKKEKYGRPPNKDLLTIIDMQTIVKKEIEEVVYYPQKIEKEIIDLMRFGNQYEVEELIDRFSTHLSSTDRRLIQDYFIQLYTSINLEIINQNYSPYEIVNKENIVESIVNSHNKEELKELIVQNVLLPFFNEKENKEDNEKVRLVKQTIEFIEESYGQDISLEESADRVDVNPYTLSKWFKEIIGINFIDYLTDYRVEKAKELLAQTDMKIGDIAESIGYQSSYFNRLFKKHTGETPGKYRKKVN